VMGYYVSINLNAFIVSIYGGRMLKGIQLHA
jgi:hypothetical protein